MELIDLIIWIIRAFTNGSKRPTPPPVWYDDAQRQRALLAQVQAIQQQAGGAGAKGRRPAKPGTARPVQVRSQARATPKPPPLPGRAVLPSQRNIPAAAREVASPTTARGRVPLRVPFVMGEILGPPVALREPEF